MTFNILPVAMGATAILGCNKPFEYYDYSNTTLIINDIGNEVPVEPTPITYTGSIQPVSNKMFEQLGLDLNKNYKVLYCPQLLQSIAEVEVPGRVVYDGKSYDIIENKNWWETNGYTRCVICENKSLRDNDSDDTEPQE